MGANKAITISCLGNGKNLRLLCYDYLPHFHFKIPFPDDAPTRYRKNRC
ncbi:uncharacterized protein G2W53_006583 [Senna tora]|uniref:Uncharacterized protein n=1 Tax=Senna tora TaxID=362788 RepID=A0A834X4D5_9FABA|nr:uncharacterized protein G2W53_006583 [Senna tora]